MKRQFKNPMYDEDPVTGKRKLLPLQWDSPPGAPGHVGSSIKKKKMSAEKRKTLADLKPLRLTDFQEPQAKGKKTDSVRKGLFTKAQVKGSKSSRISLVKRNSTSRDSIAAKTLKAPVNRINHSSSSPLLNLEEVEEEILTKKASLRGYPFKSPNKPYFNFSSKSKPLNIPQIIIEEPNQATAQSSDNEHSNGMTQDVEPKTPDSQSSSEFLKLEKMCIDSPVSSMCSLLEDTGLNTMKRKKPAPIAKIEIDSILKSLEDILENEKIAFRNYREIHEQNVTNLENLIASYKRQGSLNGCKDNSFLPNQRRSVRLQNRSPPCLNNVSPGILKSNDLLKSTLKKNLAAKNGEYSTQSVRCSQKPTVLFEKLKQPIPETPKTDRKGLAVGESPGMRYLSKMVANQCLMLQDTPVHK